MRFTIRDIIWLTTLVAVLVAWWMDRRTTTLRREQELQQTRNEVERLEARVKELEWKCVTTPVHDPRFRTVH